MFNILIIQKLNNKFQEIEERNNKNLKLKKLRITAEKSDVEDWNKTWKFKLGNATKSNTPFNKYFN